MATPESSVPQVTDMKHFMGVGLGMLHHHTFGSSGAVAIRVRCGNDLADQPGRDSIRRKGDINESISCFDASKRIIGFESGSN